MPIVIGTNVIQKCIDLSEDMESVPEVWKMAYVALQSGFGGVVRSTNNNTVELQPFKL